MKYIVIVPAVLAAAFIALYAYAAYDFSRTDFYMDLE